MKELTGTIFLPQPQNKKKDTCRRQNCTDTCYLSHQLCTTPTISPDDMPTPNLLPLTKGKFCVKEAHLPAPAVECITTTMSHAHSLHCTQPMPQATIAHCPQLHVPSCQMHTATTHCAQLPHYAQMHASATRCQTSCSQSLPYTTTSLIPPATLGHSPQLPQHFWKSSIGLVARHKFC